MTRRPTFIPSLILALAALLALGACSDEGSDPVAPGPGPDPDPDPLPVSFATRIQPIFNQRCVGCHGRTGNGGLDLREGFAYGNLVGVPAQGYALNRVEPGTPDLSVLFLKMSGDPATGSPMPPTGLEPQATRNLVRDWIAEGALDN